MSAIRDPPQIFPAGMSEGQKKDYLEQQEIQGEVLDELRVLTGRRRWISSVEPVRSTYELEVRVYTQGDPQPATLTVRKRKDGTYSILAKQPLHYQGDPEKMTEQVPRKVNVRGQSPLESALSLGIARDGSLQDAVNSVKVLYDNAKKYDDPAPKLVRELPRGYR